MSGRGGAPSRGRARAAASAIPVIALAATVGVEAGERQALAQAIDGIQGEFGVSDLAIGVLPAAMTIVGVLGAIPIGILADRRRRTRLLALAMGVWAAAMAAGAVARGYSALVVSRLAVGAVEGNSPAAVSLLADYYPSRDRARVFGLYQGGALVGALAGLVIGGVVVDSHGWRWAFAIWVPVGFAVAAWVLVLPEPERGAQDGTLDLPPHDAATGGLVAPIPTRDGRIDYERASTRQVLAELGRIPTMWLAVAALTISQFLLVGLQFWGVEFFKRHHDLSAGAAGAYAGLFGLGAAVGVVGGGFVSDRLLHRGMRDARILVIAASSIAAPAALIPAFLLPDLMVAIPFFVLGGLLLTAPIAPGEAVLNDVVVAPLRGRAGSVRAVLRSVAAVSPVAIGALSDATGLRTALAAVAPLYAVGGLLVLRARRTYAADVAFVVAETDRIRAGGA